MRQPCGSSALGTDLAAVQLDDPARDREAEPGAAVAGRARRVGAVEALEHAASRRRRGCRGLRRSLRARAPSARRDRLHEHAAVARRVPHRVLDEVRDHLVQPLGVGLERERPAARSRSRACTSRRRAAATRGARARASARSRTGGGRAAACPTRAARGRAAAAPAGRGARPARASCANVSGSGSPTPSTMFSSTACSAVIGVRSSWLTLATRSRRMRSVSASSAAIWLNERARVPISSCDVAVTRCEKSPRAIASVARDHLAQRRREAARQEPHDDQRDEPGDHAAERRPHPEPDAGPEHDDRDRDRGEDDDARA